MGIAKIFGIVWEIVFSRFFVISSRYSLCESLALYPNLFPPPFALSFSPPHPIPLLGYRNYMHHILGGTPIRYAPSEKKESSLFPFFLAERKGKKYVGLLPLLAKMRGGLLHEETIYTTHTV